MSYARPTAAKSMETAESTTAESTRSKTGPGWLRSSRREPLAQSGRPLSMHPAASGRRDHGIGTLLPLARPVTRWVWVCPGAPDALGSRRVDQGEPWEDV